MLCSEALIVNKNENEGHASILRCKRWSCELCHPFNRGRVIRNGRNGNPNIFMTLTCRPERYETPDEAARDMVRAFVLLRRRIFKRYGIKNLPFIVIFERTKKGWPHMHVLARATWLDQGWLSQQMKELSDAPIVDVRRIQDKGRAAAYVSKYVGKDPHTFVGCKRWWRSHNYDECDEQPESFFRFADHHFEFRGELGGYAIHLASKGYQIVEERPGYIRWSWPWMKPES